jgi:hypothetical protein
VGLFAFEQDVGGADCDFTVVLVDLPGARDPGHDGVVVEATAEKDFGGDDGSGVSVHTIALGAVCGPLNEPG